MIYNYVYIYGYFPVYAACVRVLLFQYGFMHLQVYLYVYILHIRLLQEFCVYIFLIACS
jgi:hypothetical protein